MTSFMWLSGISHRDIPLVGGKGASLGEMYQHLTSKGIRVPNAFVCTTNMYRDFISHNNINEYVKETFQNIDLSERFYLSRVGSELRSYIKSCSLPPHHVNDVSRWYTALSENTSGDVAVRSSSVSEDGVEQSFAGMYDTFLNVSTAEDVIQSIVDCYASVYNDRAIAYQISPEHNHNHDSSSIESSIAVVVQQMVRSDLSSSGVLFTADVESGCRDVLMINSSFGLCELVVQGEEIVPDEFMVYKPLTTKKRLCMIDKRLGQKTSKMVYRTHQDKSGCNSNVVIIPTSGVERTTFSLSDDDVLELCNWVTEIKSHYATIYGPDQEYDLEFAKDGVQNKMYLVQVRPLTTFRASDHASITRYSMDEHSQGHPHPPPILSGISVGSSMYSGKVIVLKSIDDPNANTFSKGDILVTECTSPDWEPIMKLAGGVVTDYGGRTSHASIICREWGKCCLVATKVATRLLTTGQDVTLDTTSTKGVIYKGRVEYRKETIQVSGNGRVLCPESGTSTDLMMNLASPEMALQYTSFPTRGIGLLRVEFIINQLIGVHPNSILEVHNRFIHGNGNGATSGMTTKGTDTDTIQILEKCIGYDTPRDYYVKTFAYGISKIACSVYPNPCIVRTSDFKSNEYSNLLGGSKYEPDEENPMIGFRGAARYYSDSFRDAFRMECDGIRYARETLGLTNIHIMIPFVRTVTDMKMVLSLLREHGLVRSETCKIGMMCEVPSNVILAESFCEIVDFFSIGSNDLTQLLLGIDRDSKHLAEMFDEQNEAVKKCISNVIQTCKKTNTKIGICGDAPSTYPEFADFLIQEGIDSISLSPDAFLAFQMRSGTDEI